MAFDSRERGRLEVFRHGGRLALDFPSLPASPCDLGDTLESLLGHRPVETLESTNYLAVYVILAISVPGAYLLVAVEEKELRARFGEEYLRYAERVPRFLPRLQRRISGT